MHTSHSSNRPMTPHNDHALRQPSCSHKRAWTKPRIQWLGTLLHLTGDGGEAKEFDSYNNHRKE